MCDSWLVERHSHAEEPLPEGEEAPRPGAGAMAIVRWALVGLTAIAAVAAWVHYSDVAPRTSHAGVPGLVPIDLAPERIQLIGMRMAPVAREKLSPAMRTVGIVTLELRNPGLRLRPGMFANVTLDLGAAEGLVVPSEAVVDTGELQYVFVAREAGRFEPRRVRIGSRGEGKVQLLDGVAEGEIVVTTSNFLVDSESRLRAAIESFSSGVAEAPPEPSQGHGR